ncbi:hypothetical protein PoB_000882700 [Plakobranchus ocellatus]|uniref:Uncharacterized protein n=1 Tax=Plakobranchus ocellatus TaxID=259542 RepID=A0AAV3YHJ9_9GAST|nr:hypothetical protein PoB_000882700 [Plakobranchus ocellatus]
MRGSTRAVLPLPLTLRINCHAIFGSEEGFRSSRTRRHSFICATWPIFFYPSAESVIPLPVSGRIGLQVFAPRLLSLSDCLGDGCPYGRILADNTSRYSASCDVGQRLGKYFIQFADGYTIGKHLAQSIVECIAVYTPVCFAEIPFGLVVPASCMCTTVDGDEGRQVIGANVVEYLPCSGLCEIR